MSLQLLLTQIGKKKKMTAPVLKTTRLGRIVVLRWSSRSRVERQELLVFAIFQNCNDKKLPTSEISLGLVHAAVFTRLDHPHGDRVIVIA